MRIISIIFILVIVILSFNLISANELNNITRNSENIEFSVDDNELLCENEELDVISEDNTDLEDDGYVIYVGQNITENGNGSKENPFSNFSSVSNCINGQEKVTIKIFNGTYYLGGIYNFNTSNLNIKGIGGKVIIKSQFNPVPPNPKRPASYFKNQQWGESFGLSSNNGTFIIENIIFDASNREFHAYYDSPTQTNFFEPFRMEKWLKTNNLTNWQVNISGSFINCSFLGKECSVTGSEYNSTFYNCYFELNNDLIFLNPFVKGTKHNFQYCIFNEPILEYFAVGYYLPLEINMDNCWFGKNNQLSFLRPERTFVEEDGYGVDGYVVPVSRYAIFNVTQNYLGNDQYEIIGKLTWNGTDDQDGMENFQPMTVTLESENGGEIASAVTLVNGTFKTIYKNSAANHKITATLHNQEINLEFNSVNITADPVSITYGDDQNITVKFSQVINSTVTIKVNNKTYDVKVNESDSLTYTIKDILTEGTYIVNITLIDDENHIYGINSTTLSVSKVDTPFNPNVPAENIKVGDTVTIQVTLPEGATGTVTVNVANNTFTETASANTEINITGLVAGNNPIKIVYSGDNKYANKSVDENIYAEKVSVPVTNETLVIGAPTGSATPSVSINLPENAKGNLTVTVNGKNYTQELVNGSATITLDDLPIGNHNAVVTYSGDGMYDSIVQNTTISFSGIKTSIEASNVVATYNVAKKLVVTLKDANGNILAGQKVSIKVGTISKTVTTDAKGQASVDISKLAPKEYTATINFAGDAQHVSTSANAKVTVKKAASKITAKKKTFKKAKKVKKYTITLKAGKKAISKVKVTLKIKGKTYKAKTTVKGKATFKIKKLTKKGKYTAVIKFKGNKFFKATTKNVKITLK